MSNYEKWKRRANIPRKLRFATDARSKRLRAGRAKATKKPVKEKRLVEPSGSILLKKLFQEFPPQPYRIEEILLEL